MGNVDLSGVAHSGLTDSDTESWTAAAVAMFSQKPLTSESEIEQLDWFSENSDNDSLKIFSFVSSSRIFDVNGTTADLVRFCCSVFGICLRTETRADFAVLADRLKTGFCITLKI